MLNNTTYLKRAWKHILRKGIITHKGRAALVFSIGLLTTVIQMLAVLLLVGAARAYDNGGVLEYASYSLDLNKGSGNSRIIYVLFTAVFLIFSIIAGVGNKLIITNIGRRFFEESLSEMRLKVMQDATDGRSFDRGNTLQILNRDCRYLSLSYLRVLTLLQPALFLIGIFTVAIFFVPIAALFLGLAGLIVLPFNIYLVLWAARTSQEIQDAAKIKSAEEKEFIARVSTHPFIHELPPEEFIKDERPGETGFLDAFVKRQRMGAYSQSITDLMMALVVVALALFLFFGGGNKLLLNLSNLVILVVLFRFMTGYISQIAQAVTMISSYEPFFRTLLDLTDKPEEQEIGINKNSTLINPVRLAVFQNHDTDWSDVENIKKAFKISSDLKYITSTYDVTPKQLKAWVNQGTIRLDELSEDSQAEVSSFTENDATDISLATKLLLAVSYYSSQQDSGLILNGKDLVPLGREDMRRVMSAANDRPMIVVYKNAPRALVLPPRFQLAMNTRGRTDIIGRLADFTKLRDSIIAKLSMPTAASKNSDDIYGYEIP